MPRSARCLGWCWYPREPSRRPRTPVPASRRRSGTEWYWFPGQISVLDTSTRTPPLRRRFHPHDRIQISLTRTCEARAMQEGSHADSFLLCAVWFCFVKAPSLRGSPKAPARDQAGAASRCRLPITCSVAVVMPWQANCAGETPQGPANRLVRWDPYAAPGRKDFAAHQSREKPHAAGCLWRRPSHANRMLGQ